MIKVWNVNTLSMVESIDSGSQVCNIAFSKISNEFVTTHGYSENCILLWDSTKMDVISTIRGHSDRVVYLSVGPNGERIVTGSGDEKLMLWKIFSNSLNEKQSSLMNNFLHVR